MTYTVKPDRSHLQLQLWDAETRTYVPEPDALALLRPDFYVEIPVSAMTDNPWRIVDVRKGRPLKPRYHASGRGSRGGALYNRTKSEVCSQYLQWARDKGLKQVHTFSDGICPTAPGFERCIAISSEAYFNVEETIEGDGFTAVIDDNLARVGLV